MDDWIDIKKKLPEDGTNVLVCNSGNAVSMVYFYMDENQNTRFATIHGDTLRLHGNIDYWMAIPDPPNRIIKGLIRD